jgi:hypothetical protein
MRLMKWFFMAMVCFYIVRTTYQVNVQQEEIAGLKAAIAALQHKQAENSIKRDFGSTVDQMNRTNPDALIVPQWRGK